MSRFSLVKDDAVVRAQYRVGHVAVRLKPRAEKVCNAFNAVREEWSARTRGDAVIVTVQTQDYRASTILGRSWLDGQHAVAPWSVVIGNLQREIYDFVAKRTLA